MLIPVLLLGFLAEAGAQVNSSVFIHFKPAEWKLSRQEKARLDSLTDSLYSSDRIELHGHCDSLGSIPYNDQLSQKRVQSVLDYLLANGWEKKDIVVTAGHGEAQPVHNNNSAAERSLNRRVEIRIIPAAFTGVNKLVEKIAAPETVSGTKIVLQNINFIASHHKIVPSSQPALLELLVAMRTYPKLVIQIEGHVCCQDGPDDGYDAGTETPNLSENRAEAIYKFLIANNIAPERISYVGLGHSAPLYPYPEKTPAEALANRRVEIKIISK